MFSKGGGSELKRKDRGVGRGGRRGDAAGGNVRQGTLQISLRVCSALLMLVGTLLFASPGRAHSVVSEAMPHAAEATAVLGTTSAAYRAHIATAASAAPVVRITPAPCCPLGLCGFCDDFSCITSGCSASIVPILSSFHITFLRAPSASNQLHALSTLAPGLTIPPALPPPRSVNILISG